MARRRPAEEYSEEELRRLLIEKRRVHRQARIDHFRRTGRVVTVAPDTLAQPGSLESLRSGLLPEEDAVLPPAPRRSTRRIWLDRLLFLVEIAAVGGLVVLMLNGLSLLRNLNQEVALSLVQPTLSPTPLIMAVVLPSGHIPPVAGAEVKPNDAEIPEHLRPLVQSLASQPVPTPGPSQAVRIQIPAIEVDAPVVQGDGWEQLMKGVAQHAGTPNPGEHGNIVLSGHNDIFGEVFRDLDQLEEGDRLVLFTSQHTYTYVVRKTQIVEPTQVEVMAPTQEPVVTLISCYPYRVDKKRIVITAYLEEQSS